MPYGIFWIARTGVAWRDLHDHFDEWSSVYRQLRRWTVALGRVWRRLWGLSQAAMGSLVEHGGVALFGLGRRDVADGLSRRRWLNQSTRSSESNSTGFEEAPRAAAIDDLGPFGKLRTGGWAIWLLSGRPGRWRVPHPGWALPRISRMFMRGAGWWSDS